MVTPQRIGVVGAGIVGLAVARRLQQTRPDAAVTVLEKEPAVARHQTGHNSGVVHAGVYYPPGSIKAELCLRGRAQLRELCMRHDLAYDECGKLIVASDDSELDKLADLERRGKANGVVGLRRVGVEEMKEIEPHVTGVAALHSASTAIVDFVAIAEALAEEVVSAGGEIRLSWPVRDIARRANETALISDNDGMTFDQVVVCAGLQADRLARLSGDEAGPSIVPFRGEYYRLTPERDHLVRALIYPVPDPAYPFLGVHFTRRVAGGVDVGPNAVLALAREGYRRRDINLHDTLDAIGDRGFRRLALQHWQMGAKELLTSVSRRAYVTRARRYIPELQPADLVPASAGVRAQAVGQDGELVEDFVLGGGGALAGGSAVVTVRNAPSPAATSALAIAEQIVERLPSR